MPRPTVRPTAESAAESAARPTAELAAESAARPTAESAAESAARPTAESAARPAAQPAAQSAARPAVRSAGRRPAGRRLLRWLASVLSISGGVAGAVLLFHFLIMPLFVRHGREIEVPDVRGLALADAWPILSASDLVPGRLQQAHDDHIPPGRIMRQNPPPGYRVKRGREVDLAVSLGGRELRVPAIVGESTVHARFLLVRAGLAAGRTMRIPSHAVPADQVVASSPRPGGTITGRHVVDLLVSSGPVPETFLMPDLRGLDIDRVSAVLEPTGLTVHRRVRPGARVRLSVIAEQFPPPGHPVTFGGSVELTTGG